MDKIGDRIKARRIELGLSVDQLAEKINKNRATVYRYEKNDIEELPASVIELLAKALQTTPAEIMGWANNEPKSVDPVAPTADIRRIQRARNKMPEDERDKMMKILELSFTKYFDDDFDNSEDDPD